MSRYMIAHKTERYIDVLQSLVTAYNRSVHRSIKMRPLDVRDRQSEQRAFKNLFGVAASSSALHKSRSRFQPGDYVRIVKPPRLFLKGSFEGQWTSEIFTVHEVIQQTYQQRAIYTLMDDRGDVIKGHFYAQELQRVRPLG
jgi:hypothetical protein